MKTLLTVILFLAVSAFGAAALDDSSLWNLYQLRDFFALSDTFAVTATREPDRTSYVRAATLTAFGKPFASAEILTPMLARAHDTNLDADARVLLMLDQRASFRYGEALAAIRPVLHATGFGLQSSGLENRASLLQALVDIPPQTVFRVANPVVLPLDSRETFAVQLNGHRASMLVDSGASFSVISRSAAKTAGLAVRSAGYELTTGTGTRVAADIAVATLQLGGIYVRNAVLLVVPDYALPTSRAGSVSGLLGLPVLSQLGAVTIAGAGSLSISTGHKYTAGTARFAVWDGQTLVRVGFAGSSFVCRLDTGADRTTFSRTFFDRYPGLLRKLPAPVSAGITSLGGVKRVRLQILPRVVLHLADRTAAISDLPILVGSGDEPAPYCNIGRDVLHQFPRYTLDFESMSLVLG